jgi:hypothetical protein
MIKNRTSYHAVLKPLWSGEYYSISCRQTYLFDLPGHICDLKAEVGITELLQRYVGYAFSKELQLPGLFYVGAIIICSTFSTEHILLQSTRYHEATCATVALWFIYNSLVTIFCHFLAIHFCLKFYHVFDATCARNCADIFSHFDLNTICVVSTCISVSLVHKPKSIFVLSKYSL